jgi:hypothetical protein
MKSLVLIGLVLLASQSFAQQYHSMVDTNALWYDKVASSDFPVYYGWTQSKYFLDEDTFVQSNLYVKLFRQKICWYSYTNGTASGGLFSTGPELIGGLREDSAKKVWFYSFADFEIGYGHFESDSIYLLYDFSLSVGDTFKWFLYGTIEEDMGIESIDSVQLLNGEWRMRWNLWYGLSWIEGIGSAENIFGPRVWCNLDCSSILTCYLLNDTLLYKHPQYINCYCDSTIGTNGFEALTQFSLSPNPTSDFININYSSQTQTRSQLQFTDILGRNLYATEIISGETLRLPTTLFNSNHIAFCRLNEKNYSVVKKILIE